MWLGIIAAVILILLCGYQVFALIKDIKNRKNKKQQDLVEKDSTDKVTEDNK